MVKPDTELDNYADVEVDQEFSSAAGFVHTPRDVSHTPTQLHNKVDYENMVSGLRDTFNSNKTLDINNRIKTLRSIYKMVKKYRHKISEVIRKEFNRQEGMTELSEVNMIMREAKIMIKNVRKWSRKKKVNESILSYPSWSYTRYEPKGVVLVIGPWNFPFHLTLVPVINAIAAGNVVVIKPSETAILSEKLIVEMVNECLDKNVVRIVTGAVPETTELLKVRFDHIMYTGNGFVGKIVMKAASEYLTPVTLELGGKNPVFVDDTVDLKQAARRIAAMKISSTGQICLCPDYILVHENIEEKFLNEFKKSIDKFLGTPEEEQEKNHGGKIINERHFDRVKNLLEKPHNGAIIRGGLEYADRDACFMPLTVVSKPEESSLIKQEEIFGPVVIVTPVKSTDEAIKYVKAREKPLALYIFSKNKSTVNRIINETSSGSVCVNDVVMQALNSNLPFGGVGASGMGRYRGKDGFQEFSHKRAIMYRARWTNYFGLVDPPFHGLKSVLKLAEKTMPTK